MTSFALKYDSTTGLGFGSHSYLDALPNPLPANEIACTLEQAANPTLWKVSNGALVAVPPTLAQQAQALLDGGFQVTSASMPAINGTYPCDATTRNELNGLYSLLQHGNGAFPNGVTAVPLLNSAGAPVVFPSATLLLNFLAAYAAFVLGCKAVINTNAGTLPALPVAIP